MLNVFLSVVESRRDVTIMKKRSLIFIQINDGKNENILKRFITNRCQ